MVAVPGGVERWIHGNLLVATPLLVDPNFERTVILMLEHSAEGALGVVLNRPSELAVAEAMPEWADQCADPEVVFGGGPVQPGAAFVVGERPDAKVAAGFAVVFEQIGVVDLQSATPHDVGRVRVFSGFAGWSPGQLEGELAEAAWWVVEPEPEDVFADDPDELWRTVLHRQPSRLAWFADYPDDPANN
jgi:putative transcriptional regulator